MEFSRRWAVATSAFLLPHWLQREQRINETCLCVPAWHVSCLLNRRKDRGESVCEDLTDGSCEHKGINRIS